jgi:alkanesulfonate monooxygenase SsuD/methylene tetrahydromethanopterin reductase-like flavin-dependent oxidoreductase (luciferase family)
MRVDVVLRGMDQAAMAECARVADQVSRKPVTLWLPESPGDRNPFATAAFLLGATQRTRVATGVVPIPLRSPIDTLSGALTLAEAFPGRFDLGVGSGNAASLVRAGVHEMGSPLRVATDFLNAAAGVRRRTGVAALLDISPLVEPPKVYLAAHNPRMIQLAVSAADGVLLNIVPSSELPRTIDHVRSAAASAGSRPRIGIYQLAALGETDASLRSLRRVLHGFLRSPVIRKRLQAFDSTYCELAEHLVTLPPDPSDDQLTAAIPDEAVLDFGLTGPHALGPRLESMEALGVEFVALSVFPAPLRLRRQFPPVPEQAPAKEATMKALDLIGGRAPEMLGSAPRA